MNVLIRAKDFKNFLDLAKTVLTSTLEEENKVIRVNDQNILVSSPNQEKIILWNAWIDDDTTIIGAEEFFVPFDWLFEILRKPKGMIELEWNKSIREIYAYHNGVTHTLKYNIEAENNIASYTTTTIDILEGTTHIHDSVDFDSVITGPINCIEKDKLQLSCLKIDWDGEEVNFVGTNGFILAVCSQNRFSKEKESGELLIENEDIKLLKQLYKKFGGNQPISILTKPSEKALINDYVIFSINRSFEKSTIPYILVKFPQSDFRFPNWKAVIRSNGYEIEVDPVEWKDSINLFSGFVGKDVAEIDIFINNGKDLTLKYEKNMGSYNITKTIDIMGINHYVVSKEEQHFQKQSEERDGWRIRVNFDKLKKSLFFKDEYKNLKLNFGSNEEPIVIRQESQNDLEKLLFLIVPIAL